MSAADFLYCMMKGAIWGPAQRGSPSVRGRGVLTKGLFRQPAQRAPTQGGGGGVGNPPAQPQNTFGRTEG